MLHALCMAQTALSVLIMRFLGVAKQLFVSFDHFTLISQKNIQFWPHNFYKNLTKIS